MIEKYSKNYAHPLIVYLILRVFSNYNQPLYINRGKGPIPQSSIDNRRVRMVA